MNVVFEVTFMKVYTLLPKNIMVIVKIFGGLVPPSPQVPAIDTKYRNMTFVKFGTDVSYLVSHCNI